MSQQISFLTFSQGHLQELVSKARAGDSAAFSKLAGIISGIALEYFLAKHRMGKIALKEDAEDLAQNVHLSFTEQFSKIDSVEHWLRKVLFYTFVTFYKRSKSKTVVRDERVTAGKMIFDKIDEKLDVQKILAIVSTLSEEKQTVIRHRFWDGMKFEDIGNLICKKPDAVKKIFYRAIIEIKKAM